MLSLLFLAGVWSTAAQDHSAWSTPFTFDQPPIQSGFPPVRFALLVETWQDEDVRLVPDSSGLYEVSLAPTGVATLNVSSASPQEFLCNGVSRGILGL